MSNAYALEVAFDGTTNGLVITNGAKAISTFGRVSTYGYLTRALVIGTNSSWINSGDLYIGQVGVGTELKIENGGLLSNFHGYAGVHNVGTTVTITGPGSRWINGGDLYVNYGGREHHLIISNGAVVTNGNGYVGASDASTATAVQVTGAGRRGQTRAASTSVWPARETPCPSPTGRPSARPTSWWDFPSNPSTMC